MASGNYLVAMADSLLPAMAPEDRVTILTTRETLAFYSPIAHDAITYLTSSAPGRSSDGARELAEIVHRLRPDIYWSADPLMRPPTPSAAHTPRVVFAIQELFHFSDPGNFTLRERLLWRFVAKARLRRADALICPSHALEVRLVAHLGLHARRHTHVIFNGVHPIFRHHSQDEITRVRRKWLVPKRYVLMVGHARAKEVLETPLRALASSEEISSITFLLVGDAALPAALRETVRDLHLEGMVRYLDLQALPLTDLSTLYSGAVATFEPSRYADYRPAILQSMACGTPVICSAGDATEELYGNAALRVHPTDPVEWAKAFSALTLSANFRERLLARGEACVAERTWTATAKAAFALARSLLPEKRLA